MTPSVWQHSQVVIAREGGRSSLITFKPWQKARILGLSAKPK
jgi:hypothetical protein